MQDSSESNHDQISEAVNLMKQSLNSIAGEDRWLLFEEILKDVKCSIKAVHLRDVGSDYDGFVWAFAAFDILWSTAKPPQRPVPWAMLRDYLGSLDRQYNLLADNRQLPLEGNAPEAGTSKTPLDSFLNNIKDQYDQRNDFFQANCPQKYEQHTYNFSDEETVIKYVDHKGQFFQDIGLNGKRDLFEYLRNNSKDSCNGQSREALSSMLTSMKSPLEYAQAFIAYNLLESLQLDPEKEPEELERRNRKYYIMLSRIKFYMAQILNSLKMESEKGEVGDAIRLLIAKTIDAQFQDMFHHKISIKNKDFYEKTFGNLYQQSLAVLEYCKKVAADKGKVFQAFTADQYYDYTESVTDEIIVKQIIAPHGMNDTDIDRVLINLFTLNGYHLGIYHKDADQLYADQKIADKALVFVHKSFRVMHNINILIEAISKLPDKDWEVGQSQKCQDLMLQMKNSFNLIIGLFDKLHEKFISFSDMGLFWTGDMLGQSGIYFVGDADQHEQRLEQMIYMPLAELESLSRLAKVWRDLSKETDTFNQWFNGIVEPLTELSKLWFFNNQTLGMDADNAHQEILKNAEELLRIMSAPEHATLLDALAPELTTDTSRTQSATNMQEQKVMLKNTAQSTKQQKELAFMNEHKLNDCISGDLQSASFYKFSKHLSSMREALRTAYITLQAANMTATGESHNQIDQSFHNLVISALNHMSALLSKCKYVCDKIYFIASYATLAAQSDKKVIEQLCQILLQMHNHVVSYVAQSSNLYNSLLIAAQQMSQQKQGSNSANKAGSSQIKQQKSSQSILLREIQEGCNKLKNLQLQPLSPLKRLEQSEGNLKSFSQSKLFGTMQSKIAEASQDLLQRIHGVSGQLKTFIEFLSQYNALEHQAQRSQEGSSEMPPVRGESGTFRGALEHQAQRSREGGSSRSPVRGESGQPINKIPSLQRNFGPGR